MSGLRLCTMAQWEIRQLFKQIRHEIFRVSPFFGSFLAPKCVPLGYCDEMGNRDEHCRIRPHRDTVMAGRTHGVHAELGHQDYVIVALKAHQAWPVADKYSELFQECTWAWSVSV